MSEKKINPSLAWRKKTFESPPIRDVDGDSKTTTRIPTFIQSLGRDAYAEGGIEASALQLLQHLQKNGLVSRFKEQPFALAELGGPAKRVPDVLVELAFDLSLHVIQCKSKRFIDDVVRNKFDTERLILEPLGFNFHIWTNRDVLARSTSESVRLIDRGFRFPPTAEVIRKIEMEASHESILGPLLEKFGWEDCIAAAAHGAFYLNVMEKINENSKITRQFTPSNYLHLFARQEASKSWWESLAA